MKRFLLFVLIVLSFYGVTNAQKITEQQALLKAQKFMKDKKFSAKSTSLTRARAKGKVKEEEAFYIFNAEDNKGFVIVSGDERTEEILGYSDEGNVDLNDMPDNMAFWLGGYTEQIKAISVDSPIKRTRSIQGEAIEPLIKTKWDQRAPYNLMCPKLDGQNCLTGCSATALAQILNYHKYPKDSVKALDSYSNYGAVSETAFKWDNMKDSYNQGEYSQEEAEAVAELMRYCGQALRTCYGKNESSTSTASGGGYGKGTLTNVLSNVFNYNCNTFCLNREEASDEIWEETIYRELKERRPVLYGAHSNSIRDIPFLDAHEFICDGYDGNGMFHINWGWKGQCDGFFNLSILDPRNQYTSIDESFYGYTRFQSIIIGTRPPKETDVPLIIGHTLDPNPGLNADIDRDEAERIIRDSDGSFKDVPFCKWFYNLSDSTFKGKFALALHKGGISYDNIKYIINDDDVEVAPFGMLKLSNKVNFGAEIPDGIYEISTVCRKEGEEDWHYANANCCYMEIFGDTLLSYHSEGNRGNEIKISNIEYSGSFIENEPIKMKISFSNFSKYSEISLGLQENGTFVSGFDLHANCGQQKEEIIYYTPLTSGVKELKLQGGNTFTSTDGDRSFITPGHIYYRDTILISSNKAVDDAVVIHDFKSKQGDVVEPAVKLRNLDAYVKCSFELELPKGISVEYDRDGKPILGSSTSIYNKKNLLVESDVQDNGNILFVVSCITNQYFVGENTSLIYPRIRIDGDTNPQLYKGAIRNVKLYKSDGTVSTIDDSFFNITVEKSNKEMPLIETNDYQAMSNDWQNISIKLKNSPKWSENCSFELYLPHGITIAKDKVGLIYNPKSHFYLNIDFVEQGNGIYRYLGNSYRGYPNPFTEDEFILLQATVHIAKDLKAGDYKCSIKNFILSDSNDLNTLFDDKDFTLSVFETDSCWVDLTKDFDKSTPFQRIRIQKDYDDYGSSLQNNRVWFTNNINDVPDSYIDFSGRFLYDSYSMQRLLFLNDLNHVIADWLEYNYESPRYLSKFDENAPSGRLKVYVRRNTTGILSVTEDTNNNVYNLYGRKVRTSSESLKGLPKGLYIINGKKVIIK